VKKNNKKLVIGMVGKAGSGKDTVGEYLIDTYNFQRLSLASPLKAGIQSVFMLDDRTMYDREARELPLKDFPDWSVRKLLQFVGTELFRNNFDKDIWVKLLSKQIRESKSNNIVITDVRFPNEQNYLMNLNSDGSNSANIKFIQVKRSGCQGDVGIGNHESEAYELSGDYVLNNDDGFDSLFSQVDSIMNEIIREPDLWG